MLYIYGVDSIKKIVCNSVGMGKICNFEKNI